MIIITICCENEVKKKIVIIIIKTLDRFDLVQNNTAGEYNNVLVKGTGGQNKRKKQCVWDSLTNVRGFVYYVPPPVVEGKSDLDIVQHPCYS